jgi:hypothetical protein
MIVNWYRIMAVKRKYSREEKRQSKRSAGGPMVGRRNGTADERMSSGHSWLSLRKKENGGQKAGHRAAPKQILF